jgi:hypothetical protein
MTISILIESNTCLQSGMTDVPDPRRPQSQLDSARSSVILPQGGWMGEVIDRMKRSYAGKKRVPDRCGVLLEIGKGRLDKIFEVLPEVFHGSRSVNYTSPLPRSAARPTLTRRSSSGTLSPSKGSTAPLRVDRQVGFEGFPTRNPLQSWSSRLRVDPQPGAKSS